MSSSQKVDLLFNAFNEIDTIEDDIKEIVKIYNNHQRVGKIIIVEDGSFDGTAEKLRDLKKELNIELNQSENRRGYSKALIEGIQSCDSEYIFFSDLGGKFNWSQVDSLINLIDHYDFIVGVRTNRQDRLYRKILTKLYSLYLFLFYRIKSKDPDSGFRIYKKNLINKILKEQIFNKHLLNSEFTIKSIEHGARYKEVSIDYYQRKGPSRGLPLSIIPNVVFSTIKNSFKIKKQVRSYEE